MIIEMKDNIHKQVSETPTWIAVIFNDTGMILQSCQTESQCEIIEGESEEQLRELLIARGITCENTSS